VWVESFADSGINLAVRFWHPPDIATLWRTRSQVAVAVKRALDEDGIRIPFPQRVVRFADDVAGGSARDRMEESRPGD
jgi:small conductance mechanosensitive channel